jgi:DNA-binding NarL/FixJ family response regulator
MKPKYPEAVRAVLILNADQLCAEILRQYVQRAFPHAQISLVGSVDAAAMALAATFFDLFVASAAVPLEGDILDLMSRCAADPSNATRLFVVTTRRDVRLLSTLRILHIDGVFDSADEAPAQLIVALKTVAQGRRYWSPVLLQHMQQTTSSAAFFRLLTELEQLVLAVIGDGSDDIAAAHELDLSPATVSTVRRDLHRKLGVQHRGELIRLAAQHGFVHFMPEGILRPAFSILRAAYHPRRARRPTDLPLRIAPTPPRAPRRLEGELARPAA